MESVRGRGPTEAHLLRSPRDQLIMHQDRYRRAYGDPLLLHHHQGPPGSVRGDFTTTGSRLRKHLNVFSRKKPPKTTTVVEPTYYRCRHTNKYGSVSALSTSAIYGELRPPPSYAAVFGSTGMRHPGGVRGGTRATVYPWETFINIGEPIYEDVLQEVVQERQPPLPQRLPPPPLPSQGGSLRSPRRKSILPDKIELYALSEECPSSPDRNTFQPRTSHRKTLVQRMEKNPFSSVASRKSILECDVSAYDMVKKYLKSPDGDFDSDLDEDDLSDNAIYEGVANRRNSDDDRPSPKIIKTPRRSHSGSEQDYGYGRRTSPSVRMDSCPVRTPPVAMPEPDYDEEDSDASYDMAKFKDLRISYSPPLVRKPSLYTSGSDQIRTSPDKIGSPQRPLRTRSSPERSLRISDKPQRSPERPPRTRSPEKVPCRRDIERPSVPPPPPPPPPPLPSLAPPVVPRMPPPDTPPPPPPVPSLPNTPTTRSSPVPSVRSILKKSERSLEQRPRKKQVHFGGGGQRSASSPPPPDRETPPLVEVIDGCPYKAEWAEVDQEVRLRASATSQVEETVSQRSHLWSVSSPLPSPPVKGPHNQFNEFDPAADVPKNGSASPADPRSSHSEEEKEEEEDDPAERSMHAAADARGKKMKDHRTELSVPPILNRVAPLPPLPPPPPPPPPPVSSPPLRLSLEPPEEVEQEEETKHGFITCTFSATSDTVGQLPNPTGVRTSLQDTPTSRSTFYVSIDGSALPEVAKEAPSPIGPPEDVQSWTPPAEEVEYSSSEGLYSDSIVTVTTDSRSSYYEDVKLPPEPIYEELPDTVQGEENDDRMKELSPATEPPCLSHTDSFTRTTIPRGGIFEGASRQDILLYLEDAKERGVDLTLTSSSSEEEVVPSDPLTAVVRALAEEAAREKVKEENEGLLLIKIQNDKANHLDGIAKKGRQNRNRISNVSNASSSSSEHSTQEGSSSSQEDTPEGPQHKGVKSGGSGGGGSEVERNDSGVGTETSHCKPVRLRRLVPQRRASDAQPCADCDAPVDPVEDELSGLLFCPLVCKKCDKKRSERKEIIAEIVETELKYGRDLSIIREEFFRPMEVAGLLSREQLRGVFLNLEELSQANAKFAEKLQDALDIADEQGDEDFTTVNIGKHFLESTTMLHAFETYCVRQGAASLLLTNLEKEKELLRIFLRVSQMENTLLRRMNLAAFLMVPVQRVTKYPLLLARLQKVTPHQHADRDALREAQQKMELHLEHINQQTKGASGTKIWRRISNISTASNNNNNRRLNYIEDIGSIKLRKMALEVLKWNRDEVRFVMGGRLLCAPVGEHSPWSGKGVGGGGGTRRPGGAGGGKSPKFLPVHGLLVTLGKPNANYRPETADENGVFFPRNTGIRDATLLLIKEKNGRLAQMRVPLHLASCVVSCDLEGMDRFEVQEYHTKEAYIFKCEDAKETKEWCHQLRYHAKDLGNWRKRRNALANIMINGMIRH